MPLHLSSHDRQLLCGDAGDGARLAMRLVVKVAEIAGAPRLIDSSVVIGVLVADELYGRPVPVLVVPGDAHAPFRTGEVVTIATGGLITRS